MAEKSWLQQKLDTANENFRKLQEQEAADEAAALLKKKKKAQSAPDAINTADEVLAAPLMARRVGAKAVSEVAKAAAKRVRGASEAEAPSSPKQIEAPKEKPMSAVQAAKQAERIAAGGKGTSRTTSSAKEVREFIKAAKRTRAARDEKGLREGPAKFKQKMDKWRNDATASKAASKKPAGGAASRGTFRDSGRINDSMKSRGPFGTLAVQGTRAVTRAEGGGSRALVRAPGRALVKQEGRALQRAEQGVTRMGRKDGGPKITNNAATNAMLGGKAAATFTAPYEKKKELGKAAATYTKSYDRAPSKVATPPDRPLGSNTAKRSASPASGGSAAPVPKMRPQKFDSTANQGKKTNKPTQKIGFKGNWVHAAPSEVQKRGGARLKETAYQRMLRLRNEK